MINLIGLFGTFGAVVLIVLVYAKWRVNKAKQQVDNIMRANIKLLGENMQLKNEKAVVEKQVKNYKVKQKNDETTNSLGRDAVIDELRENGDLRSE
ncbi:DUF2681 domain-containing protein [Aggregatibacter actinomycetemcomitans]|uniref:DUF2681 domain-containing protein n=1 Tax=Aggregatibacter actinomycetemcomitans TaxID=714 RepID=UPI00023FEC09|nr:DUF2681 domain-containing protein [Aggregatibacter actinomycetemcomitans]EHK89833.1 hypothetical protein RHAA1_10866 [Aggregatibacter actinomycetemcomitans RhAA1]KNE76927.1 hypothetical protein RHAA2_11175 [Aggregatibacter actinomycetemcomitans RhAA1]